jgi:hypothetical protein
MGAEIPQAVRVAVRLMYAGLAASVIALIVSGVNLGQYTRNAAEYKKHPLLYPTYVHASQMASSMSFAVLADLIGIVCWVVLAIAARHGRGWARITGTVLLGIYTLVLLSVLVSTKGDPGAQFLTLLVWALGVAATVLLWTQQARAFFAAWGKR